MGINTSISSLPTPPSRTDPASFNDRADAFLSALPGLQAEINEWAAQANALALTVDAQAAALLNYAGEWSSQMQVQSGQVVAYNNILWRAKLDSCGVTPESGSYWEAYPLLTTQSLVGRNVVINGDCAVWQRGESITTTADNEYTADRWGCTLRGASVKKTTLHGAPYSLLYQGPEATNHSMFLRLESCVLAPMAGRTVTLSYSLYADHNTSHNLLVYHANSKDNFSTMTTIHNESKSYPNNTETRLVLTLDLPPEASNGIAIYFQWVDAEAFTPTVFIWDVQLENGACPTEFERVPYDVQLARCMRYYERLEFEGVPQTTVCTGVFLGTTAFVGDYKFKVPKRVRPSMTAPSGDGYYMISASNTFTLSGISQFGETSTQSARIGSSVLSHTLAGQAGLLLLANSDAWLAWDAEL